MDYDEVHRILDVNELGDDPAFGDVDVFITPILPDRKGNSYLGLYFPDQDLILLPPTLVPTNGSIGESVILHEFGHRHGHFYFNDLSEAYAEKFRRKYQEAADIAWDYDLGTLTDVLKDETLEKYGLTRTVPVVAAIDPCHVCKAPERLCPYCDFGRSN